MDTEHFHNGSITLTNAGHIHTRGRQQRQQMAARQRSSLGKHNNDSIKFAAVAMIIYHSPCSNSALLNQPAK
eukprot:scaffold359499_cov21-Prasinocladus_malaysianus.AAC.1